MKVKNAKFVISAVSPKQYPEGNLLEIAFAGRSNVGKSSLINALVDRKNLAYSGSRQGMTRQINYYNLDNELHFVDLPGYGYAAVSKSEKNLWGKVIEDYLDIRHKPSKDDENMYRWILASGIDYLVVATKADKISRQQMKNNVLLIRNTLQIPSEKDIICVSAQKRTGIENLWAAIDEYIVEEDVNPK